MNAFEYLEPNSVDEAARLLRDYGARARVLAGGTDLLIQMEGGRHHPEALISLRRIPGMGQIHGSDEGGVRIGAGVTLRQVENHPIIAARYPALSQGAREVGSVQIRNLATLAGNVCNASPSADTSPALLAYEALVELVGGEAGIRRVPLRELWTGPGRTTLQPGELLTAVLLPSVTSETRAYYQKLAVRKAMDLAMVGLCVVLTPGETHPTGVRIALGAVAPVCLRATEAEAAVERGGAGAIAEAAALAEAAVSPIDDQRASAGYRREMVRVLTTRALTRLLQ